MDGIPNWLITGTAPQWALLVLVSITLAKLTVPLRQQNITTLQSMCDALKERVDGLLARLDECEARCEQRDDIILGMKKQATAQQISFVRLLMTALGQDNPELQHMLTTLESMEKSLEQPIFLESTTNANH